MNEVDQKLLDDLIRRVGFSKVLETVADHTLFESARFRRKRDQVQNQEAKARYRLLGRKLESISYKLTQLSVKLRDVEGFGKTRLWSEK